MSTIIHPDDQRTIEKQHGDFVNGINDRALTFQDDAYALGLARGLKEGKVFRDELLEALEECQRALAVCRPDKGYSSAHTRASISAGRAIANARGTTV